MVQYTHFVGVRLGPCPTLNANVELVQKALVECEPKLQTCLVPASKLHVTAGLLCLEESEISEAIEALRCAAAATPAFTAELPGLDAFGHRVLFARVDPTGPLETLASGLGAEFAARGLRGDPQLVPHATVCKLSRFKGRKRPKILAEYYESLRDSWLGSYDVTDVQLLELRGSDDGYYKVVATAPLLRY